MKKTYNIEIDIIDRLKKNMRAENDEIALKKAIAIAIIVGALADEDGRVEIRGKTIVI